MSDYLSYLPYISFAAIVLGLSGLGLSYRRPRQQLVKPEPCEVVTDWRPTGKIDFTQSGGDEAPRFYLQTEEFRVLQSPSGTKRVEVRWRPAVIEEAKRVASATNSRDTIFSLPLPASARAASLVPSLPEQEPLPGGNVHPRAAERPH